MRLLLPEDAPPTVVLIPCRFGACNAAGPGKAMEQESIEGWNEFAATLHLDSLESGAFA